jgi:16S rRNA (uracil1498-N3)-methyltransferase
MPDRYFSETPITPPDAVLAGSEAHHLLHVMRAKPGDRVVLFDGSGAEFVAEVARLERSEVRLTVVERHAVDRESPRRITLAVALPKGDRQRWLIEKATELGAARVIPLRCERAVAEPNEKALARLRRAVIEASKQCGRNRLMEIAEPVDFDALLESTPDAPCRLIAQPGGSSLEVATLPDEAICAVGPEGGFTDAELQAAAASGWQPIGLGARILRVETAALALLARLDG